MAEPKVWLIADRSPAVIQEGQPPAQQAAWLLDIPEGENGTQVAADFAAEQGFPVGTVARVIDLTADPPMISTYKLVAGWQSL